MKLQIIITILIFGLIAASAQQNRGSSCEEMSGILDSVLNNADKDDVLVVVARLGTMDKNPALNVRRLSNIKMYLTQFHKDTVFAKRPENLVLATGEAIEGQGVIELYFKGKLFETLTTYPNGDLYVGECSIDHDIYSSRCEVDSEKVFYPCRED